MNVRLLVLAWVSFHCLSGKVLAQEPEERVTLLFAGDIMQHDAQLEAAFDESTATYSYDSYFTYVEPIIKSVDLAIVNLELTLAGEPFSGYPRFSAPDELAEAIKKAGFDIIVTANNHSCDLGREGIERTLDVLQANSLKHTGTFKNQLSRDKSYPLIVEKNGFRLAFLNYTYGTNHIDIPHPNIVNLIDSATIVNDLKNAGDMEVDASIVTLHWGKEYERTESKKQRAVADLCIKHGATLVIGSHPHVIQPMEMRESNKNQRNLVVYSLGNYISNQRARYKDGGVMVFTELVKSNETVNIDSAGYILTWVYIEEKADDKRYMIVPASLKDMHTDVAGMNKSSSEKMNLFIDDSRLLLKKHNRNVPEILIDRYLVETSAGDTRDTTYCIQLFASSDSTLNKIPAKFRKLVHVEKVDGVYKYVTGSYFDYLVAKGFRDFFMREGYEDVFIVTYYKGKRLK